MSQLNLKNVIEILKNYVNKENLSLEVLLVGGLALHHYGMKNRATIDIDAEVKGDIEGLFNFLKSKQIPADLGEDFSGWSIVAMPDGYRERAIRIFGDKKLTIKVLHPVDFIHSKIRRFTEEDIEDAIFVAKKFNIKIEEIEAAAADAIKKSPKDTVLFIFKKNLHIFLKKLKKNL